MLIGSTSFYDPIFFDFKESDMKRVLVDFDGVIHRYSKGWADGSIYDLPVDGVQECLQKFIDDGYEVVVYSTRCHDRTHDEKFQPSQLHEVKRYLDQWGVPYTSIFAGEKPYADLLIDDNALRFKGNWKNTIKKACKFLRKTLKLTKEGDKYG
jgi:hypothetical protein